MTGPAAEWRAAFLRALAARGRRRRRIVAELDDHLASALDSRTGEDPAAVRAELARIGDPVQIADGFRSPPRSLRAVLVLWLPAAVAATICAGMVELAVQQSLRSSADDPQIQLVEAAAGRLAAGAGPGDVVGVDPVDLARSLAPAVTVLDDRGRVLASSARLDDATPQPPSGALAQAGPAEPYSVTWQPVPGVRQAAVISTWSGPAGHGTLVASRSLREVEQRESRLVQIVLAGWVAALVGAGAAALLAARLRRPDDRDRTPVPVIG